MCEREGNYDSLRLGQPVVILKVNSPNLLQGMSTTARSLIERVYSFKYTNKLKVIDGASDPVIPTLCLVLAATQAGILYIHFVSQKCSEVRKTDLLFDMS